MLVHSASHGYQFIIRVTLNRTGQEANEFEAFKFSVILLGKKKDA